MPESLRSLIIALVLLLLLAMQARRSAAYPRLRQTFSLGAGTMGAVAVQNLLVLIGFGESWLATALMALALALFLGIIVTFATAVFNGELRAKLRQAQSLATAERASRAGRPSEAAPPASEEHDEHRA
jgi:hypothetical protein